MFFKRFALLTTAIVLVMSVDYLGVVRKFTPGATAQGGLGEFLALPVLTCAGLMWMASAVDFVMIFVSLELVTISFYVLVSYTRRNAASLEAGVKYLILGALSTGFFVYGITWIFGITGRRTSRRLGVAGEDVPGGFDGEHGAGDVRVLLAHHRARVQDRGGAVPDLGAGRLSGCADAGDGVSVRRFQGGGIRGVHAGAGDLFQRARLSPARWARCSSCSLPPPSSTATSPPCRRII